MKPKVIIKDHLWRIDIELFNAKCYFLYADKAAEWKNYIEPLRNDDTPEWYADFCKEVDDCAKTSRAATIYSTKHVVILMQSDHLKADLLVHEAVHAMQAILQGCGVSDTNGEVDAYLTSTIYKAFHPLVTYCKCFAPGNFPHHKDDFLKWYYDEVIAPKVEQIPIPHPSSFCQSPSTETPTGSAGGDTPVSPFPPVATDKSLGSASAAPTAPTSTGCDLKSRYPEYFHLGSYCHKLN